MDLRDALKSPIKLVPVVELEPSNLSPERQSPRLTTLDHTAAWDAHWRACLADAGVGPVDPIRPASWLVPVERLVDPIGLRLLIDYRIEAALVAGHLDLDQLSPLPGGLALTAGDSGVVLVEPSCCCDLGNHQDWRVAASYRESAWTMLWVGHPWVSMMYRAKHLFISGTHEDGAPVLQFAIKPEELTAALAAAVFELVQLRDRLRRIIGDAYGAEMGDLVADRLAGMTTGHSGEDRAIADPSGHH